MHIIYKPTENLAGCWEAFLDKLWDWEPAITMVYSPRIGEVILELNSAEIKRHRDNEYFLNLSEYSNITDELLFKLLRKVMPYNRKRLTTANLSGKETKSGLLDEWFKVNQSQSKELKICFNPGINTYLHYYFLLSIILAHEEHHPWFYGHFTNICLRVNDKGYAMLDFLERKDLFDEVVRNTALGYDAFKGLNKDPCQFIIEGITQGNYVLIHLDEIALNNKHAHKYHYHYVQQSLIYGYDLETGQFKAIGFDQTNKLNWLQFTFDEVESAFQMAIAHYRESAPWADYKAVQLIRMNQRFQNRGFQVGTLPRQLRNFLASTGSIEEVHHYVAGETIHYGWSAYQELKRRLQRLAEGENHFDYRVFHLLYEHKHAIYERLKYIAAISQVFSGKAARLIAEYEKVVNGFNGMRLNVLKRSVMEHAILQDIYRLSNHPVFVQRLIQELDQNIEQEWQVLNEIDPYLANWEMRAAASKEIG